MNHRARSIVLLLATAATVFSQPSAPPVGVPAVAEFKAATDAAVLKIQAIPVDGQALTPADAVLARRLAMAGLAQLVTSEPASFKAVSEDVLLLAQAEVIAQNAVAAKLAEIAGDTELPKKLDDAAQERVDQAKTMTGKSRETVYLKQTGLKGHTALRSVLLEIRAKAQNPALKQLAETMLPMVDLHLSAARAELGQVR